MSREKYMEMFKLTDKFAPPTKRFFEDFSIGDGFVTPAKYISLTDMDLFCLVTEHKGFHIDPRLAKSFNLKDKVAPGLFILSLVNGLIGEIGLAEEIGFLLGVDNVRFRHPVFPGDSVMLELELIDKKDVAKWKDFGIITFRMECKNQDEILIWEGNVSYQCRCKQSKGEMADSE